MDKKCNKEEALQYLENLVGESLYYGIKAADMELYDFGFGERIWVEDSRGDKRQANVHNLHIICDFKVIWRKEKRKSDVYFGDTAKEKFEHDIRRMIGHQVKKVALSDKNDFWLDLDECWIVFATREDDEESWRYFMMDERNVHLVAANTWLEFVW